MGKMTIFAVAFLAGLMQMSASELAKVHDPSPSTTPSNEDSTSLGKVAVTLQVTMGSNEYTPVIFGKQLVAVESIFKELIEEDPNVFVNSIGMVARHIGENFPDRLPGFIEAKAFVFVRGTQGDVAAKNSVAEFFATLKNSTSDGDGVVKALNDRMVELLGQPSADGASYVLGVEVYLYEGYEDVDARREGDASLFALMTMGNQDYRTRIMSNVELAQGAVASYLSSGLGQRGQVKIQEASEDTMIKAEFMVKLIGAQDNKGAKDSLMEQYKNNLGHAEDISYHTPKLNALMAELIGADASSNVVSQVLFTGVSAQAFDLSAFLDDGKAASVSSRLSNVSFDKADYDDRTRAYMDFEAKFLDDLELIVKSNPDCGDSECRPLAEIADVDFISGSRKLLESDVEITSNIYNVDGRETVKAINDRCANSCMLGGMTTEEGAVSVKEGAAEPVTGGEPVTGDDGGSSGAASKAFAFGSTFFFAMLVAMMV